jgi:molybdenum cofactor guanylyltransferase
MTPCSAALIAGGKSSRMGRDKCLIERAGTPLWKRQSDLLRGLAAEVMIVAPARPGWCPRDLRWIADEVTGAGPLGGLAAALSAASHPRVIVLAVDLPQMSEAYLRRLLPRSSDACGVVPLLEGFFQPLSAVYPRAAAGDAAKQLGEPDRSLQRLMRRLIDQNTMRSVPVAGIDRPCFRNLNAATD